MTEPNASNQQEQASSPNTADAAQSAARWRRPAAITTIVLAAIVVFAASIALWANRQALNTDQWTSTSVDLLQDDEIRHALSVYIVDSALAETDIAGEVRQQLPLALRPLAAQLAGALRGGAINVADEILASDAAQKIWEEINRVAHTRLMDLLERDSGAIVTLNLGPFVDDLRTRLGLEPRAATDTGTLVVLRSGQVKTARTAVRVLRTLTIFLWLAAIALIAAAIWLAGGWRRRAILALSWTAVGVGFALLITRRVGGRWLVDSLATTPNAEDAARAAWRIETSLLADMALVTIVVGVLVAAGTWLTGEAERATALRRYMAPAFRKSPIAVWGGFALVALIVLALLPDNNRRLLGTLALLALIVGGLAYLRQVTLRENPPEPTVPATTSPPGRPGGTGP